MGWQPIGYSGGNHLILQHENGNRYILASTPGEYRGRMNSISMLTKLSKEKVVREEKPKQQRRGRRQAG